MSSRPQVVGIRHQTMAQELPVTVRQARPYRVGDRLTIFRQMCPLTGGRAQVDFSKIVEKKRKG